MRRDSVLRSTPLRLALGFAVIFIGAFLVTGFAAYQFMKWELLLRHDQAIRETYAVIAAAYGDKDLTDFLDAIETNVKATRGHYRVFLALSPAGKALAGNISAIGVPDGWSDVAGARLGLDKEFTYRLLAGTVAGNRLIVGMNYQEIDDLEAIALASFAWTAIAVAALALAGGALIAARARRRFDAVRDTMGRVSHGDLAARIPLLAKGDDIDLLSQDINEALDRLAATVEGMRQVSSDIAHDLKTPLNRLKLTIESALARQGCGLAIMDELESASAETDRIAASFDALLRIAQIESGARKARFTAVDLAEVIASLVEIYGGVAEDAGQALTADLDPGLNAVVSGDRELLVQMYANLIENAIRHCPAGTKICCRTSKLAGTLITIVEDSGLGIPKNEHVKVFRRLYRLEKSRTSSGTGLGLSLVKAVADLHGAEIRLEDAGPGLRVAIIFAVEEAKNG